MEDTYNMIGFVLAPGAHHGGQQPWVRSYERSTGSVVYQAHLAPQRPFKPRHLFLDGELSGVWVESILVGQHRCAQVANGALPARLFHLAGISSMIEVIEEHSTKTPMVRLLVERRDEDPDWPLALDMDVVRPGMYLTVELFFERPVVPGERLSLTFAGT